MSEHDMNDDRFREMLRRAAPEPPYEAVDWLRLQQRIAAGTSPVLRGRGATWWHQLARWSPRSIPAAAAVAVLAAVLLVVMPGDRDGVSDYRVVEEVLADAMTDDAMTLLVPETGSLVDALLFTGVEQ